MPTPKKTPATQKRKAATRSVTCLFLFYGVIYIYFSAPRTSKKGAKAAVSNVVDNEAYVAFILYSKTLLFKFYF
jgi:hypothetical protein